MGKALRFCEANLAPAVVPCIWSDELLLFIYLQSLGICCAISPCVVTIGPQRQGICSIFEDGSPRLWVPCPNPVIKSPPKVPLNLITTSLRSHFHHSLLLPPLVTLLSRPFSLMLVKPVSLLRPPPTLEPTTSTSASTLFGALGFPSHVLAGAPMLVSISLVIGNYPLYLIHYDALYSVRT